MELIIIFKILIIKYFMHKYNKLNKTQRNLIIDSAYFKQSINQFLETETRAFMIYKSLYYFHIKIY